MDLYPENLSNLDSLVFDNRFIRELAADPEPNNFRRQVFKSAYSRVQPTVVSLPELIAYSEEMATELGLSKSDCLHPQFAQVFAGNKILPGMDCHAMCYGGHQFGNWAGQLGDGRAINLGEVIGQSQQHWALQLKGSGETPYSRNADGLAVLRSSVREFLCSEAMYHLGIPTTRALSLVLTGESVVRDMFYDGNPKPEPGAIVCRVAPSFIRFGSFQIHTARKENDLLKQLMDFTIQYHFPDLLTQNTAGSTELYLNWFQQVCLLTAEMIVHWQRVGFVHGVMNTDNMSILGLTIDYGPYGWLDDFDPHWTPNTTDAGERRYRYSQQPEMALWNLLQLANAIYPVCEDSAGLENALSTYQTEMNQGWETMMAAKLGLEFSQSSEDHEFLAEFLGLLSAVETDMTLFYRRLAAVHLSNDISTEEQLMEHFNSVYYRPAAIDKRYREHFLQWFKHYLKRCEFDGKNPNHRIKAMNAVNPKFTLRNYLSQIAIDKAEQGDYSEIQQLLNMIKRPYDEQAEYAHYSEKRPDWARSKAGCSMLSCSS